MAKPEQRDKNWIRSASGGRIYLDKGDFSPWAIASGLAKVCRYGGQCTDLFYSVAQHSVLVARYVPAQYEREALLHDGAEGLGFGDICRPWKQEMRRLALMEAAALKGQVPGIEITEAPSHYDQVSNRIEAAVAKHYGVQYPWPAAVKEADTMIVADEIRALFKNPAHHSEPGVPGYGIDIIPLNTWQEARDMWLEAWYIACGRHEERLDYWQGD